MSHPGAGIVTTMVSSPLRELEAISRVSARDRILIAMRRGGGAGMVETPDKVAALIDATRALGAMGAPHALIGGVAVGVQSGVPPATADTDSARADPGPRRSKALRDLAVVDLLRGVVP